MSKLRDREDLYYGFSNTIQSLDNAVTYVSYIRNHPMTDEHKNRLEELTESIRALLKEWNDFSEEEEHRICDMCGKDSRYNCLFVGDISDYSYVCDSCLKEIMAPMKSIIVMQECQSCGSEFPIKYYEDGTYDYINDNACCDDEGNYDFFVPVDGQPSISQWIESLEVRM